VIASDFVNQLILPELNRILLMPLEGQFCRDPSLSQFQDDSQEGQLSRDFLVVANHRRFSCNFCPLWQFTIEEKTFFIDKGFSCCQAAASSS
jgi:hypothetical protein